MMSQQERIVLSTGMIQYMAINLDKLIKGYTIMEKQTGVKQIALEDLKGLQETVVSRLEKISLGLTKTLNEMDSIPDKDFTLFQAHIELVLEEGKEE